jgi:hypothetical protein
MLPTTKGNIYYLTVDSVETNQLYRKSRARVVASPPFAAVPSRIPTPPYEIRPKPPDRKGPIQKRKNQSKQSQSDVFPWNRQIDFKYAKVNAAWNDEIYDEATLKDMEAIRARNAKIVARVDGEEIERAREYHAINVRYG